MGVCGGEGEPDPQSAASLRYTGLVVRRVRGRRAPSSVPPRRRHPRPLRVPRPVPTGRRRGLADSVPPRPAAGRRLDCARGRCSRPLRGYCRGARDPHPCPATARRHCPGRDGYRGVGRPWRGECRAAPAARSLLSDWGLDPSVRGLSPLQCAVVSPSLSRSPPGHSPVPCPLGTGWARARAPTRKTWRRSSAPTQSGRSRSRPTAQVMRPRRSGRRCGRQRSRGKTLTRSRSQRGKLTRTGCELRSRPPLPLCLRRPARGAVAQSSWSVEGQTGCGQARGGSRALSPGSSSSAPISTLPSAPWPAPGVAPSAWAARATRCWCTPAALTLSASTSSR